MQNRDLTTFKDWFNVYSRTFYTADAEDNKNIDLKIRHTFFVCENAFLIAKDERLNDNDVLIAETAALFHDVGRFLQFSRYRTFRDNISVNHGRLGADILREKNILSQIPLQEQELIINTVQFHNAFEIPSFEDERKILFLRVIRDADKLDIWRVFAEYYHSPEDEQASAVSLGLPDLPDFSKVVLSCLYEKKLATLSALKTQNDFKLMQLSWVYGLHFRQSFRLMAERNLIDRIMATLPQTEEIAGALAVLREFADGRSGVKTNEANGSNN
jgi:putative nucleotidyltransferase with HDIG domain